jgi:hypothetical protein
MKNRFILTFGLALLAGLMVFSPSCNLVMVDDPDLNANDQYKLDYVIQGTVMVADDYQAIEGATVKIGSLEATTDANGKFSVTTKDLPPSGTLIEVSKDGFAGSNLNFSYGSYLPTQSVYNFLLTRKFSSQNLNTLTGGEFQTGNLIVNLPSNNQVSINGTQVNDIELSITPLHNYSSIGEFSIQNARSVQKFSCEPSGSVFSKPLRVSYFVGDNFHFTKLSVVALNESSNKWEVINSPVSFDPESKRISFEIPHFSIVGLIDQVEIDYEIGFDPTNGVDHWSSPWKVVEASTCNCEGPIIFSHSSNWLYQLTNEGTATWDELIAYNIPQSAQFSYYPGLLTGNSYSFEIPEMTITDCFWIKWDLSEVYQRAKGSFLYTDDNGVSEVKTFDIKLRKFISSSDSYFPASPGYGGCPVTSNCHQGGHQGGTSGC